MVEFVRLPRREWAEQLYALHGNLVAHYDREGWTAPAHRLLRRLNRYIAKHEG